jgi:uncharacterized protein (TIGR01777 family)
VAFCPGKMKILVTGATGLIGSALTTRLVEAGHQVTPISRSSTHPGEAFWNPATGRVEFGKQARFDAIIHLAGESIAQRWSPAAKQRIRASRVETTHQLSQSLTQLSPRPAVLLCASATGFYGDRGDEALDERSAPGSGFLAELCREWEAATEPAQAAGVRVANPRFGVVLSPKGGALKKMLPIYRGGLGGKIGNGRQFWSWIALPDAISAIEAALTSPALSGPINIVSPNPVRNGDFSELLGQVAGRPAWFTVPHFALKLAMGEMGKEALLASQRVSPGKLAEQKFHFKLPELRAALVKLIRP